MSELIRIHPTARIVADDDWQFLQPADEAQQAALLGAPLPAGRLVLPLALWQARGDELTARGDAALWLSGDAEPGLLADRLPCLPLVAIHFPRFGDGRGYSLATLLRQRHGYRGELRAFGEVLRDQFYYLQRCGFDTLQPPPGHYDGSQLEAALASLADFSDPYQAAVRIDAPLFARANRSPL